MDEAQRHHYNLRRRLKQVTGRVEYLANKLETETALMKELQAELKALGPAPNSSYGRSSHEQVRLRREKVAELHASGMSNIDIAIKLQSRPEIIGMDIYQIKKRVKANVQG